MRKVHTLCALLLLSAYTSSAIAEDQGLYMGLGVGAYALDIDDTDFDDNATVAKAIAGVRITDHLALEVDYQKFFEAEDDVFGLPAELEADAWTASVRPIIPITDLVDLYAKVGYTWYDFETEATIMGVRVTDDESDSVLSWGGGVDVNLGNVSFRGEVTRIEVDDADLNLVTAGVIVRF